MICHMQLMVKQSWPGVVILFLAALLPAQGDAQTKAPGLSVPAVASIRQHKLSPLAEPPNWQKLQELKGMLTLKEFETAVRDVYADGSAFPPPWQVGPGSWMVSWSPGFRLG